MQASADLRTLSRLRDEQHQKFGREPRADELAEASGIPEARILDLVSSFQETLSLDAMVGEEQDGSLLEMTTDPSVTSPEQDVLAGLYSQTIHRHIAELHPRERLVLEGRFGLHGRSTRTLEDIAGELRISRERVRQIELRAINRLRRALSSRSGD
jgi:RNA polymerase primary sigma factor